MSERSIVASEFFSFVDNKSDHLCRVSYCRKDRAPHRTICYKCNMQLFRARNPMRATWNNLKGKSKQRRIKFTLTFEQFRSICEATGYMQGKGHNGTDLSLDRMDPNKGYEMGNIQVVTISENSSKGSYERWVTTKDGRRVRLYQIGVTTEEQHVEDEEGCGAEWEPPRWLEQREHIPTDTEPF